MGRLIESAKYSNEDHAFNALRRRDIYPTNCEQKHGEWEGVAERMRVIDPDGSKSRELLRRLELGLI